MFVERANRILNLHLHLGNESKQLYVLVVPIIVKCLVQRLDFAQIGIHVPPKLAGNTLGIPTIG